MPEGLFYLFFPDVSSEAAWEACAQALINFTGKEVKKRLCAFSAELHYLVNEREAKARFEIKTRYLTHVMELS